MIRPEIDLYSLANTREVRLYACDELKLQEKSKATGLTIVHLIRSFVHLGIETEGRRKKRKK